MIDIYMTSFSRLSMTLKSVDMIHKRTKRDTFQIHIFDNGSDQEVQGALYGLLKEGKIASLHLDSRNTGCLYNKGIFHMMTEATQKYYVVTDNDVYPPDLTPDWLEQMIDIMEREPNIALLAPQLPPQWLQEPDFQNGVFPDFVYCKAVGNTFKVVRRESFPIETFHTELLRRLPDGSYSGFGDDGIISRQLREKSWKIAFCRNIYCYHAGQCENWGYKSEEINKDPRKSGYGKPYTYFIKNEKTWEPLDKGKRI